jgi:hypothetical protein
VLAASLVAVALCCTRAGADDGSSVRDGILAAMAATTSFAVDVVNPQGIVGTAVVLPKLGEAKVQGSAGPQTLLAFVTGGAIYTQFNGGAWQRQAIPADATALVVPLTHAASITPGPDQRDRSGATFGAFTAFTSLSIPGLGTIPNVALDCTYDKLTMLLHACTCQYAAFTFRDYNDPKNVVALPDDVRNAAPVAGSQGR